MQLNECRQPIAVCRAKGEPEMSNSLSQVQAALRGLSANGAAGPLTLNVLHKTEALVSKLLSFDTAKPVTVEVLSAAGNGRASVSVGGLTLDVKASLPLRAGEVFQLRIEKAGANVRLVQPLGKGAEGLKADGTKGESAKGGGPPPDGARLAGQSSAKAQPPVSRKTPVGGDRLSQAKGVVERGGTARVGNAVGQPGSLAPKVPVDGAARGKAAPVQAPVNGVAGTPRAIAATQVLPASLQPAGQISAGQLASLGATPPPVPGGAARPETLYPGAVPKGVNAPPPSPAASAISSTNGLQGGVNTTALIRAVVEALPAIDKRQDSRLPTSRADGTVTARSDGGQGRAMAHAPLAGAGGSLTGGGPIASVKQVQASYKQFAGGAVEELSELQSRGLQKAPDASFELPLGDAGRAVAVQLYVSRDGGGAETGEQGRRYAVRFSMDTDSTGPVHAEINLFGRRLQLNLWAERAAFYTRLSEQTEALQVRLAATGLEAGALTIRHGRPPDRVDHWDESV